MSITSRSRVVRTRAVVAAAALVVGTSIGMPQMSAADGPDEADTRVKAPVSVKVSGDQIAVDLSKGQWRMTGGLIGSWTITASTDYYASSTRLYQKGVEAFDGCLNLNHNRKCDGWEPNGTWKTEYMYWASFRSNGTLVDGDCVHPLTGGSAAFTGVRGVIFMDDDPVGNTTDVTTTYFGEVILNAVPGEQPVATMRADGLRAASTTRPGTATC